MEIYRLNKFAFQLAQKTGGDGSHRSLWLCSRTSLETAHQETDGRDRSRGARVTRSVQQVEVLYPQLRGPPPERLRAGAARADDGAGAAAVRAFADEALLPQRARLVQHDREGGNLHGVCRD